MSRVYLFTFRASHCVPLVENAFIHGVEPKEEEGLVELSIDRDDGFVMIRIRDNGLGISDQEKRDCYRKRKKIIKTHIVKVTRQELVFEM